MATVWGHLADVAHRVAYAVTRDGHRTRFLEAGTGPPVILLHGTGGHLETFARNVGPLSRHFRVLAFDLLGHGFTDKPSGPINSWAGLSRHVLQMCDVLDVTSPVLVGEALGAQLGQWIALEEPQRVRGVILGCALIPPVDHQDSTPGPHDPQLSEFHELTLACLASPTVALMRRRMQWLFADPSMLPEELVELRTKIWADDTFPQAHRALLDSYRDPKNRAVVTLARLSSMAVSTVVVWSRTNPLMSLETADRITAGIPNRRLEVFGASKLWPQFEEADRFNQLVIDFVNSLASQPDD